jgi:hypothetical protein
MIKKYLLVKSLTGPQHNVTKYLFTCFIAFVVTMLLVLVIKTTLTKYKANANYANRKDAEGSCSPLELLKLEYDLGLRSEFTLR